MKLKLNVLRGDEVCWTLFKGKVCRVDECSTCRTCWYPRTLQKGHAVSVTCPSTVCQMLCSDTFLPTAVWARYGVTFQQICPSEYTTFTWDVRIVQTMPISQTTRCVLSNYQNLNLISGKGFSTWLLFSGISLIHVLGKEEYLNIICWDVVTFNLFSLLFY